MIDGKSGDEPEPGAARELNDGADGGDLKRDQDPATQSTGAAVDVDAAHDRSS